jgi:hypothetical protein
MGLHRIVALTALWGVLLAGCNDDRRGVVGDGGTGDGAMGDGSTPIVYTERVCGFPFPSAMQVDMVATDFCRCYEEFEYASEEACIAGFRTEASDARNMLTGDTALCACIMDATTTHVGAIDDYQRCLGTVYSDYLECYRGAACGSGRQATCTDTADAAGEACLNTSLTGAAQDAIMACM